MPRARLHSDLTLEAPEIDTIVRAALESVDVEPDSERMNLPSVPPPLPAFHSDPPPSLPPMITRAFESEMSIPIEAQRSDSYDAFPHLETTARLASPVLQARPGRTLVMPSPRPPSFFPQPEPTSPPARPLWPPPLAFAATALEPTPVRTPRMPVLTPWVRPVEPPVEPLPPPSATPTMRLRKRRSTVPYVTLLALMALGVAMWLDPSARAQAMADASAVAAGVEAKAGELLGYPAVAEVSTGKVATIAPPAQDRHEEVGVTWQPSAANVEWGGEPALQRAAAVTTPAQQTSAAQRAPKPARAPLTTPPRPMRVVQPAGAPRLVASPFEDDEAADLSRQAKQHLDTSLDR